MISVIIPTYNRRRVLGRAIESVLRQSVSDWELIVVDDGSSDGTEESVRQRSHDERLSYVRLAVNQGVAQARNAGIEQAEGEYLVFLDSDDELLPQALATMQEQFRRDAGLILVSAPYRTETGELTGFDRNKSCTIRYEELLCQRGVRPLKFGVSMVRRSLLGEIRFVEPNLDFIFYRRIAKRGRMYFVAEPLGIYHASVDPMALHRRRRVPDVTRSIQRARALVSFLEEFGRDLLSFCPRQYSYYAYGAAVGLMLEGKKREALRLVLRALRHNPTFWPLWRLLAVLVPPGSRAILHWLFNLRRKREQEERQEENLNDFQSP